MRESLSPLQSEAYRLALRLIVTADDDDESTAAMLAVFHADPRRFISVISACATYLAQNVRFHAEDAGRLEDLVRVAEAELFRLAIGEDE